MFRLFASTYKNMTNPIRNIYADKALDLHRISDSSSFNVSSLDEAVQQFQASSEYIDFCEKHCGTVYIYLLKDNGETKQVG